MSCDIDYAGDAEADQEVERASWDDLTPEEAIGRAIYESKEQAIKEIRNARKESTVLSYKMVIVGAMLGFLGSFLVSVLLHGMMQIGLALIT